MMPGSESQPDAQPAPLWKPLTPDQRRVLGVMVEKAKTTPATYPMTVNAIVVGCNQKNNREPLTALDDFDVERILDELTTLKVVSESPLVSRAVKYMHHAYEWLKVDRKELAVMTELLLRGEQTLGDLRARAARMEPIEDVAALKTIVDGLVQRGLMIELTPPGRGQIVSHNLYREPELAALRARHGARGAAVASYSTYDEPSPSLSGAPGQRPSSVAPPAAASGTSVSVDQLATLSAQVSELQAEVARLREQVASLAARLGATPD